MATRIGKYIVSTVGEYWPDQAVRRFHAEIYDPQWYTENSSKKGDDFDHEYMQKFGYEDIGCDRKYETMVGHAQKVKRGCCPYRMVDFDLDFKSYNTAEEAYKGHMKMCAKFATK